MKMKRNFTCLRLPVPARQTGASHRQVWILTSLMLIGLLGLIPMNLAAQDPWIKKANMPTARNWLATCAVNGKLYAIGGWNGSVVSAATEEYDPVTDTWTRKADMPTARDAPSAVALNGKLYVIGGFVESTGQVLSTVEEYDPVTNTWTKKANMPAPRANVSTAAVNGKIYAISGTDVGFGLSPLVEEYDPATDTWTKKSNIPTPRGWIGTSAAAVNGRIYVIGGWTGGSGPGLSIVEEYDPATDTWTRKADMPTARGALAVAEVNGKIYAIGGGPDRGVHPGTVEEFDPATNTWTKKADMLTGRFSHSVSAVNGEIYVIGGVRTGSLSSAVEKYNWLLAPRRLPQGVNAKGKLATLWGRLKATE